ncbi:MAG: prepilin-type N-terminal cleavage/methylation domain-containing protein [Elusimicrobia bacterium]|nr:prepilin-type N-terminal cleavage/methylation domain-containing protein [Elusimicrobiota bacterium]
MNKRKYSFGFTLIEVMVSLFLSVMVAFFVYTMMISSYSAYNRLSSVSKNANSIRYFITNFSNSIKYCDSIPVEEILSGGELCLSFTRYDKNYNTTIKEKYYFSGGGGFVKSSTASVNLTSVGYHSSALGLLKKDICRLDNSVIESITISNIIRTIYFDWTGTSTSKRMRMMNIGVIYDDVIDGRIDKETGIMQKKADGSTEMLNNDTITKRLFRFCFRTVRVKP